MPNPYPVKKHESKSEPVLDTEVVKDNDTEMHTENPSTVTTDQVTEPLKVFCENQFKLLITSLSGNKHRSISSTAVLKQGS